MSLLSCHWNNQIPKKRKFKFLLSKLFYHYHLCCFELICSKIVITYVDNSGLYHWLCENYSRAEFVAIQNGHSTKNQLKNTTKQYHQHFFCFGEYDKSRYEKFDHTVLNSYPVGSFKLGIYDKYFVKDNKEIYDIGIISQFRPFLLDKQIELNPDMAEAKESQFIMHKYLSRYIKEQKINACIIMSSNDELEIDYFNNIYNMKINYFRNAINSFSSYDAVFMSKLVVGFNSALISEASGMQKKLLRIDFTKSNDLNDYDPLILLKNPSYEELAERLDQLLAEPYDLYRKRTKEYASYVMNYNPDCPPHINIRNKIEEYL